MSYRPHYNCRACGYGPAFDPGGIKNAASKDHLESVLNLGVLPLPNAFCKTGDRRPGHYPVDLLVCPKCYLGQLSAVVDPAVMYSKYAYVTSTSQTMLNHFESLWKALSADGKIESVVEIGSNDGLCLEYFRNLGASAVMGIDPAENLAATANKNGVTTICSLFDRQAADMALSSVPPIDVILARHVFCHVDDWQSFVNNCAVMATKDTRVCIEVPYAPDMLRNCEWDTVYAEHLSYLTIRSMQHLLDGAALKLHRIIPFPIHGGAIALILRRRDNETPQHPSVLEYAQNEDCRLDVWNDFAKRARDQITNLRVLVNDLVEDGKTVAGYGASAKSTMWINACGFTRKQIRFIADCTPAKWYTTSPGTDIPVLDEGALTRELPDYAVCFCWNFLQEVMDKEAVFRKNGGRWIVPVPTVEIV